MLVVNQFQEAPDGLVCLRSLRNAEALVLDHKEKPGPHWSRE